MELIFINKIKRTDIFIFFGFIILSVSYLLCRNFFIRTGSKIIWNVDKCIYSNIGIYLYEGDYVITPAPKTSTDYEFEQLCELDNYLSEKGIDLLYVNKPAKYLDDSVFDRFDTHSYCNRNADKLLKRLDEQGINYLDLREEITKDGLDVYDLFYRTDHHWTVPAALWGTEKIAAKLNDTFGYNIDLSIYDDEKYTFDTRKEAWYGEQGKKFEGAAIKKDDYTLITPDFETSFSAEGEKGDFTSVFIKDPAQSFHYNYDAKSCINHKVKEGNILFIGDSYDLVTEPFLSLGVHKIDFVILRDYDEPDIYKLFLEKGDYDTVIVCYAPFMIGAHDNESSTNYNMFHFK